MPGLLSSRKPDTEKYSKSGCNRIQFPEHTAQKPNKQFSKQTSDLPTIFLDPRCRTGSALQVSMIVVACPPLPPPAPPPSLPATTATTATLPPPDERVGLNQLVDREIGLPSHRAELAAILVSRVRRDTHTHTPGRAIESSERHTVCDRGKPIPGCGMTIRRRMRYK